jgi:flavodoxin
MVAKAMTRVFEAAGHRVEYFGSDADSGPLAAFDFIVLGAEPSGMGKLPPHLHDFLSQCYGLAGKRSFAFVLKSGFRPMKALARLMATMEGQGMRVSYSDIIHGPEDAAVCAKSVPIQRD